MDFLEELEATGKDPQALRNRPILDVHTYYYIESFFILSARRPVNTVEGAIPISEMVAYLQLYPWYDNDLFVKYMLMLDNVYLRQKKESHDNKAVDFRGKGRP